VKELQYYNGFYKTSRSPEAYIPPVLKSYIKPKAIG